MFIRNELDERGVRSLFTRRAAVVTALQAIGLGVLTGRLYQLQVMEGNRFAPLADRNRTTRHSLAPIRGIIYDRAGRVLADNVEDFRLVLTPALTKSVRRTLMATAKVVDIDPDALERAAKRARRQAGNIPIVVAEELDFDQVARINVLAPQLPGIDTELVGRRRYFQGASMSHIVGHVGGVERFALDDDPILRLPGVRVGKIGVERAMEDVLRGVGGYVRREVDARGRVIRDLERKEPERGRDIALSIDTALQEQVLKKLSRIKQGAAVAMRVDTGEMMAMASWPTTDISELAQGVSQKKFDQIKQMKGNPLFDRSIRGLYPPGSTYKMITALAALESGDVTLGEKINCQGTYHFAKQKYRCWNRGGHGPCNMHRAIRESCDTYFYEISRRMGPSKIAEMAERFGLGQVYEDMGLAFQKTGVIPTPTWKRGRFSKPWYDGETLLASIGQGYVASTPLQLAVMTARLASGLAVEPRLVLPSAELPGMADRPFDPIDVNPRHLAAVQRAMRAVVHERSGTGKRARLGYGVEVAGKTGTSQVTRLSSQRSQKHLKWRLRDHALFVAYFPYDAPKFAVSVIVEHGESGGKAAAPLAREIMALVREYDRTAAPPFTVGNKNQKPEPASGRG